MKIRNYKKEDIGFPQDIKHWMKNTKNLTIKETEQFSDELYILFSNENLDKNKKVKIRWGEKVVLSKSMKLGIIKIKKISKDGTKETGSHWSTVDNEKPIIAIDFDHTITKKCMACDDGLNGDGIQDGAKEGMELLSKYFRLWIYSGTHPDYKQRDIEGFLKEHNIVVDRILRTKPPACFIIDDRAIYHTSWTSTINQIDKRLIDKLDLQYLEK